VAPESSQFWHPIEIMPTTIPGGRSKAFGRIAYREKITQVIQPAYRRLYDFLAKEYAPHARQTDGLGAVPGGRDLYRYYVKYHTTTDLTPKEIHALGLAQVREISRQLAAIEKTVGFQRLAAEVLRARFAPTPQQHFGRPEEVLPGVSGGHVIALFPICRHCLVCCPRRRTRCVHCRTRIVSRETTVTTRRPAGDGSRPGVFCGSTSTPRVVQDNST